MDPALCEFLAENELVQILPNFNEEVMHLICGDVGPFEAGVPVTAPLWLAVHLKKRHKCTMIPPDWLNVTDLKKFIVSEGETNTFSVIPKYFFEISHIMLIHAKEDIEQVDQVRTLVKDLWDKREAKMRTSTFGFLSQYEESHARVNNLTQLEISQARPVIAESCKTIELLNDNLHSLGRM